MRNPLKDKHSLAFSIVLLYLLPFIGLSAFGMQSLSFAGFGLLLTAIGSTLFFLLLTYWQKKAPLLTAPTGPFQNSAPPSTEINRQIQDLETENEQLQQKLDNVKNESTGDKLTREQEVQQKEVLLEEYQQTIKEQREVIESKHHQIAELEGKIEDLNYEMKTLLQLVEMEGKTTEPDVETEILFPKTDPIKATLPIDLNRERDIGNQLRKNIDIAQKMTGASHFNQNNSLFQQMTPNNYALDLRRLFDRLQSENAHVVFVYSRKEDRILCVTPLIKELLGFNAERFAQNFTSILSEGQQTWREKLNELNTTQETTAQLLFKHKSGEELLIHCQMGTIRTGIFKGHVIAMLYS